MITKRSEATFIAYLNNKQFSNLKRGLTRKGWDFREDVPHAFFSAKEDGVSVTAFKNGKLLVQGKDAQEFIEFYLEPEILKEITLGYEEVLDPTIGTNRIGVDESGKGDYFGPLVIAAVHVEKGIGQKLLNLGVTDSKLTSVKRAGELAEGIKQITTFSVVAIGPEKYNQLYEKIGNLNRLLAWGHARGLENVLIKKSGCKRAILDKFCDREMLNVALMKRGKKIDITFNPKAETDIAVAAASIIARDEFCTRLKNLEEEYNFTFPRGAGSKVRKKAKEFVTAHGVETLTKVAKLHFKISKEIILES